MPNQITVAGQQLVLNGMGIREATVFNVDVYVAGLYVVQRSSDGNAIAASTTHKRLVLHFVEPRKEDDGNTLCAGILLHSTKDLVSIHAGHDDIEEHQIHGLAFEQIEGARTVHGNPNVEIIAEGCEEDIDVAFRVIHQKDLAFTQPDHRLFPLCWTPAQAGLPVRRLRP